MHGEDGEAKQKFMNFVSKCAFIRHKQPVLHRRKHFQGKVVAGMKDIAWYHPEGRGVLVVAVVVCAVIAVVAVTVVVVDVVSSLLLSVLFFFCR